MNIQNKNSPAAANRPPLSDKEQGFIREYASLLAPWGMPLSTGRVFGYLLLIQAPVSVDQIAADLEMSRVGAWNAAKNLESFGHIHRYGTPGSKRSLYAPSDNFADALIRQAQLIGAVGALLSHCAETIAAEEAAAPLAERGQFYASLCDSMESAIAELNAGRK